MLWAPSYSGQLLSNWDTGSGCREPGIFSLPNTINMTWINCFTFPYFTSFLYIYLFCFLTNAPATPLKLSQPSNKIIFFLCICRSWTRDLDVIPSHYLSLTGNHLLLDNVHHGHKRHVIFVIWELRHFSEEGFFSFLCANFWTETIFKKYNLAFGRMSVDFIQ